MEITKVYYEELRSVCINGKWTSKKIGVEVPIEEGQNGSYALEGAKEFVQRKLDEEMGDNKKTEELRKLADKTNEMVKNIFIKEEK